VFLDELHDLNRQAHIAASVLQALLVGQALAMDLGNRGHHIGQRTNP
jgi:hypothetical protein